MQPKRIYFLDFAKATAAFFMILIHVQGLLSSPKIEKTFLGTIISVLGEAPSAPIFMFTMGASFAIANKFSLQKNIFKGIQIFIKGYTLNLLRLLIPFILVLILTYLDFYHPEINKTSNFKSEIINNILVVDILQFAGLAYIFISLLAHLNLIKPKIIIPLIIIIAFSSHFFWGYQTQNIYLNRLIDLFLGNNGEFVSFPFFPWITYPLLGVLCGNIYKNDGDINTVLRKQMKIGLITLIIGAGITVTNKAFHLGDYWRTGPGGMLIYLGFIPIWIYVCEIASKHIKGKLLNITCEISKNITKFYIIQWLIISSFVVIIGKNQCNLIQTTLLNIFIIYVTYQITIWKMNTKIKKNKSLIATFIFCLMQISCTENQENILTDKLLEMRIKEIKKIESCYKLNEIEKEEGIATVNSIYSFSREIADTKDNYYAPHVLDWITADRKFAGDNPDTNYYSFFIDPKANYEIEVSHKNNFHIEITSYKRINNQNMISNSIVVPTFKTKIEISNNTISNSDLKTSDNDYIIMIRYYKLEAEITPEKPFVTCTKIPQKRKAFNKTNRYNLAVKMFDAIMQNSILLSNQMEESINDYVDQLDTNNNYIKNLYPSKNNRYNGAFIQIPEGKYLSVKGKIDTTKYTSFVFYNRWWATSFQNRNKSYINNKKLQTDINGNYEIIISNEETNKPNNIVIHNLKNGILSIRSIYEEINEPSLELKSL